MLAAVASATLNGALGRRVSVEVHVSNGLPGFTIVGLPDAAVREARDRVRAAVLSSGLSWPSPSASWWPLARSAQIPPTGWRSAASSASTGHSATSRA